MWEDIIGSTLVDIEKFLVLSKVKAREHGVRLNTLRLFDIEQLELNLTISQKKDQFCIAKTKKDQSLMPSDKTKQKAGKKYAQELSDSQWQVLLPFLPQPKKKIAGPGRPPRHPREAHADRTGETARHVGGRQQRR